MNFLCFFIGSQVKIDYHLSFAMHWSGPKIANIVFCDFFLNPVKFTKIITFCENYLKKTKETVMFIKGWRQGCKKCFFVKLMGDIGIM